MCWYYVCSKNTGVCDITVNSVQKTNYRRSEKGLLRSNLGNCGRSGKIVCRHRGGGHKRLYRKIDFARKKIYEEGLVHALAYDPNRNSSIAMIHYNGGTKAYILSPKGIQIGICIIAGFNVPLKNGNSLPLWNVPFGIILHNVELYPGSGGSVARAAGTFIQLIARENGFASLRIPSGEIRLVSQICWATIGQVGNAMIKNKKVGKAGRKRWLGRRPVVRGRVINPVDHPHGGGEGRRPIGRIHPYTPWGNPRLGVKTRSSRKYSTAFILRRR
jgi:large subunit ribosomal protein L2